MKIINLFLLFMAAVSLFCMYLYGTNICLENRIKQLTLEVRNTYNLDSGAIQKNIALLQAENNSFSSQIERQSDFFIFWTTGLFVILSLFGITVFYRFINTKIKDAKTTIRNDYKEQKRDYMIHKKKVNDLQQDVYTTMYKQCFYFASNYLDRDPFLSLNQSISGVYYIYLLTEKPDELKDHLKFSSVFKIIDIIKNEITNPSFIKNLNAKEDTETILSSIRILNDIEIKNEEALIKRSLIISSLMDFAGLIQKSSVN